MKAIVKNIPYREPVELAGHLCDRYKNIILLESANHTQFSRDYNRYSYIGLDPFEIKDIEASDKTCDIWAQLNHYLNQFKLIPHEDLPPFQGGIMGYLGYELNQTIETVPISPRKLLNIPDAVLGCYDLVLGFDHEAKKAYCFSSGYPELNQTKRLQRAKARANECIAHIHNFSPLPALPQITLTEDDIQAVWEKSDYIKALQKVDDYIHAGDIYEANITQAFQAELPETITGFEVYRQLRQKNPASYAAYLDFEQVQIISASPERFLTCEAGEVITSPIKGTCPRGNTPEEDAQLAQQLQHSEKDKAENLMIVDLMRNDLSRVCVPGSVKVPALFALETLPTVHHLVSHVTGTLEKQYNAVDLLKATFPGGSITGAPKIRAMEVIAECEPVTRGPYCGSVFYLGFDGALGSSIIIRTFVKQNRRLVFNAGGAIVADSNPESEYQESLVKVLALKKTLGG